MSIHLVSLDPLHERRSDPAVTDDLSPRTPRDAGKDDSWSSLARQTATERKSGGSEAAGAAPPPPLPPPPPPVAASAPLPPHAALSPDGVLDTPVLHVDTLAGVTFANQYVVASTLGRGAHGAVKAALDTREMRLVALKVMPRASRADREAALRGGRLLGMRRRARGGGGERREPNPTALERGLSGISVASSSSDSFNSSASSFSRLAQKNDNGPGGAAGEAGASPRSCSSAAGVATAAAREASLLRALSPHPHLVRPIEVIDDPRRDRVLLVLEHAPGGSVGRASDFAPRERRASSGGGDESPVPRALVRAAAVGAASALAHLHSRNVAHGDVKPDNMLLMEGGGGRARVVLADLGSARPAGLFVPPSSAVAGGPGPSRLGRGAAGAAPSPPPDRDLSHLCGAGGPAVARTASDASAASSSYSFRSGVAATHAGTPAFTAPEEASAGSASDCGSWRARSPSLLEGSSAPATPRTPRSPSTRSTATAAAADMWALGVSLYCLAYGTLPFSGSSPLELYENIAARDPPALSEFLRRKREEESDGGGNGGSLEGLLSELLDKDPATRATAERVLSHPWVAAEGEGRRGGGKEAEGGTDASRVVLLREKMTASAAAEARVRSLSAGELLARKGDPAPSAFFVLSGSLEVVHALGAALAGDVDLAGAGSGDEDEEVEEGDGSESGEKSGRKLHLRPRPIAERAPTVRATVRGAASRAAELLAAAAEAAASAASTSSASDAPSPSASSPSFDPASEVAIGTRAAGELVAEPEAIEAAAAAAAAASARRRRGKGGGASGDDDAVPRHRHHPPPRWRTGVRAGPRGAEVLEVDPSTIWEAAARAAVESSRSTNRGEQGDDEDEEDALALALESAAASRRADLLVRGALERLAALARALPPSLSVAAGRDGRRRTRATAGAAARASGDFSAVCDAAVAAVERERTESDRANE